MIFLLSSSCQVLLLQRFSFSLERVEFSIVFCTCLFSTAEAIYCFTLTHTYTHNFNVFRFTNILCGRNYQTHYLMTYWFWHFPLKHFLMRKGSERSLKIGFMNDLMSSGKWKYSSWSLPVLSWFLMALWYLHHVSSLAGLKPCSHWTASDKNCFSHLFYIINVSTNV